jgi:hypothetical protein
MYSESGKPSVQSSPPPTGLLPVGCVIPFPRQYIESIWGLMVTKKWYKTSRPCHCGIRTLDLSRILPTLQYKNEPPNSSYPHFVINIMLHTNDNFTMSAVFTIMMTRLNFLRLWIIDLDVLQKRPLNNVATRNKFPCRYIDHVVVCFPGVTTHYGCTCIFTAQ